MISGFRGVVIRAADELQPAFDDYPAIASFVWSARWSGQRPAISFSETG
jgi:hypothetical protein